MTRNPKWLVFYAYATEFVLVGLVYLLILLRGWLPVVMKFLEESAVLWTAFFGIIFAVDVGAWLVFFTFNTAEFGAWLEWKGANRVYSAAFLFDGLLFALAAVSTLISVYFKATWMTKIALGISILGLINVLTMAMLIYWLTRLQALFNLEYKKAMTEIPVESP